MRGYAPGVPLIAELLARRVRSDGAAPLVTCYDDAAGTRGELSGTTVANWVAKTSNLLTDELLLPADAAVELLVAGRHPGHWMTLVWALAFAIMLIQSGGRSAFFGVFACGLLTGSLLLAPDWTRRWRLTGRTV